MITSFFKHYLELPSAGKSVVCLGGGVGTAQVLSGLRFYNHNLTAIVSMADDGGSAGRLRRAFAVPPPGDLINCLAALSDEQSVVKKLLVYRFAGKRYGKDTDLGGQKLGNLIFVALTDLYHGDAEKALVELSKIISSKGRVLPATTGDVNIWAKTVDGKKVAGEQNIDLGKYEGTKTLKEVHLSPENIKAYKSSIEAIETADLLVVGPGDLFTTVLPVVIVNQIKKSFTISKAKKVFIVNIANKPFETTGFKVSNYLKILDSHLGRDIFDTILVNTNQSPKIPRTLKYKYVLYDKENLGKYLAKIEEGDFVDSSFPIYHDSQKIADRITKII